MRAVKLNFLLWPAIQNIATWTNVAVYVLGIAWMDKGAQGITVGALIMMTSYVGTVLGSGEYTGQLL